MSLGAVGAKLEPGSHTITSTVSILGGLMDATRIG